MQYLWIFFFWIYVLGNNLAVKYLSAVSWVSFYSTHKNKCWNPDLKSIGIKISIGMKILFHSMWKTLFSDWTGCICFRNHQEEPLCSMISVFMEIEDIIYTVPSPFFIQSIFTFFHSILPGCFVEGCLWCSFVVLASWWMGWSLWIWYMV